MCRKHKYSICPLVYQVLLERTYRGRLMIAAIAPQLDVCPEYQLLLEKCQKALVSWQQRRSLVTQASLAGKSAVVELRRLQANYVRAYALLDGHEHSCRTCQYISKIGGLDFDSMSRALYQYRRTGTE
jgi:hypothetical protein